MLVDPGCDYYQVSAVDPGAVDYVVQEVKYFSDETTRGEAARMVALKTDLRRAGSPTKIGLHVDLEYPTPGGNTMTTILDQVFSTGHKAPSVDMVWNWEAQCEYLTSMKDADPDYEHLSVSAPSGGSGFVVTDPGTYAWLIGRYSEVLGPYCLYRHVTYNLANGYRSQRLLQSNAQDLIERRWKYLYDQ